jgi:hypothetical protein
MAEADIGIYIATAGSLAITCAILFVERGLRHRLVKGKKAFGFMGMDYEAASTQEEF